MRVGSASEPTRCVLRVPGKARRGRASARVRKCGRSDPVPGVMALAKMHSTEGRKGREGVANISAYDAPGTKDTELSGVIRQVSGCASGVAD